jgi:hypothetical protein
MRISKRARKVTLHTDKGPSLEGILLGRSHGHYILRAVALLKDEEESHDLDGEIRVPRERVVFFQVTD